MLLIPGALFELALPFWLFTKGFGCEAWAGRGGDIDRSPVPGALPAPAAL
jgi:hypothetical protein